MERANLDETPRKHPSGTAARFLALAMLLWLPMAGFAFAGPPIVELDITPAAYQDMYDNGLPAGYRPISATAHGPLGQERFTAAWIDDGVAATDWIARHGLTHDELQAEVASHRPAGFRLFCLDSYGTVPNERYVALWIRDGLLSNQW